MSDLLTRTLTSMEVATMVGKRHADLMKDIRLYCEYLAEGKVPPGDFFIESTYKDGNNQTRPCFNITKKGCELVGNKMIGAKGVQFTALYVNKFNELEEYAKQAEPKIQISLSQQKRLEIMEENAKTRKATILYKIAMATGSDISKERLLAEAGKTITGEMVLPIKKQKEYSAGAVAELIGKGLTANMVGRISNNLNLKAEQPGQNEYGRWANGKSQHSVKEVPQWMYFDKGMDAIKRGWENKK